MFQLHLGKQIRFSRHRMSRKSFRKMEELIRSQNRKSVPCFGGEINQVRPGLKDIWKAKNVRNMYHNSNRRERRRERERLKHPAFSFFSLLEISLLKPGVFSFFKLVTPFTLCLSFQLSFKRICSYSNLELISFELYISDYWIFEVHPTSLLYLSMGLSWISHQNPLCKLVMCGALSGSSNIASN